MDVEDKNFGSGSLAVAPSCLSVKPLDVEDVASWTRLEEALADAPDVQAFQAWRAEPEPGFRPMRVKAGWTREALVVHAVLEDADIFNPERRFNAMSFMAGDVFEMFLRPVDQEAYFEFHVTPENQKLQLRFPSARAFSELRREMPPEWFINHRVIASRVRVTPAEEQWEVVAEIPFDLVCENSRPGPGMRWLFSFSRYDYTRGNSKPVLSSTSPHTVLGFHRQEDWGELEFN